MPKTNHLFYFQGRKIILHLICQIFCTFFLELQRLCFLERWIVILDAIRRFPFSQGPNPGGETRLERA